MGRSVKEKTRRAEEKSKKEDRGKGNNNRGLEQNKNPFPQKWMNECYQKLIFPNPSCIEIMEKISRTLPRHILRAQTSEQKQQALFLLLGEDFTEHHFPKNKYNVEILEPPKIDEKQKQKYLAEMKAFLDEALCRAMEDCGFPRDLTQYKKSNDEMGKYLEEIKGTFKEAYTTNVILDAFEEESRKHRTKISDSDDAGSDEEIGTTYTEEADAAGRAFIEFMSYDDNKKDDYKKEFKSKQVNLPLSLRQYYWWEFFETRQKGRLNLKSPRDNVKMAIIRDFEENLKKSMKKQKLPLATKSLNAKDIDSHMIELYDTSPPLKALNIDDILMKTSLAVNMADIHSNNYTPVMNLILLPFQMIYKKKDKERDEDYIMLLAMQLSLFSNYAQLSQHEIFTLAEDIIDIVADEDPEYLRHIRNCLSNQSNRAKPSDFPPEVFLNDTRTGLKVFNDLVNKGLKEEEKVREKYIDEFTDPAIFIRKWIGQVFVGVLSVNGMMWAWDQAFLSDWSRITIKNIAISILALIKPWMLRATMYSGARKVFIEEPSKLYTSDLRNALKCIEEGKSFSEIPPTKNFLGDAAVKQKSNDEKKQQPMSSNKPSTSKRKPSSTLLKPFSIPVMPFGSTEGFDLNVDLKDPQEDDDEDDDHFTPVPEPLPDSESEPEEEIVRSRDPDEPPTPPDSPPPRLSEKGWVAQDPDPLFPPLKAEQNDPFDFYIDYIRFLPDNIRVCKVTAKLVNSNLPKNGHKPVVAFPLLESYQRSPTFRAKQTINPNMDKISSDSLFVVNVYGYQESSSGVVTVGSCLLSPFVWSNGKYVLKAGGHQIRLRHTLPNQPVSGEKLKESNMAHNSPVAGTSICVRLLKSDQIYDPTPKYEDKYYESSSTKPSTTELRLFYHYIYMEGYATKTVGDELRSIRRKEGEEELENGPELQKYYTKLLDHAAVKKKLVSIPDLDFSLFVKYDDNRGVNVCIQGAFGLPEKVEGFYLHAFGEVLPGKDTKDDVTTDQRKNLQVVTRKLDLDSYQRSPDWLDLKTTLYPPYDEHSVLLIQIFGIKVNYIPSASAQDSSLLKELLMDDSVTPDELDKGGTIVQAERGSFEINYEKPLGWSIMSLFHDGYAQGGLHLLAVFKGKPHSAVLSSLQKSGPVESVLKKYVDKESIQLEENSFMEVEVYDGHVESDDLPEPAISTQLNKLEISNTALRSRVRKYEAKFSDFVLKNMKKDLKKLGAEGRYYDRESYSFQHESDLQFILSLNTALEKVGKPPFSTKL